MSEIKKNINGFTGYYKVSDLGNIISLRRNKILIPSKNKDGYLRLVLCVNGVRKYCNIHRLVAETFISNPDNKPVINHKNGIKTDNRAENLEWCTVSENTKHSYELGLQISPMTGVKGFDNKNSRAVRQISKSGTLIKIHGSCRVAAENSDFDSSAISKAARGIYKSHKNYTWEYVRD